MKTKHIGTWVLHCDKDGILTKWGQRGGDDRPFPPFGSDAHTFAASVDKGHRGGRVYLLHVFDDGRIEEEECRP